MAWCFIHKFISTQNEVVKQTQSKQANEMTSVAHTEKKIYNKGINALFFVFATKAKNENHNGNE